MVAQRAVCGQLMTAKSGDMLAIVQDPVATRCPLADRDTRRELPSHRAWNLGRMAVTVLVNCREPQVRRHNAECGALSLR